MYQRFPFQGPLKYTQIGIFGGSTIGDRTTQRRAIKRQTNKHRIL
jgi:hypothetical protein